MGRDVDDRLGVVEIVAIFEALALGNLRLGGDDLAGLPDDPPDGVADVGKLTDCLGEDEPDPVEHLLGRFEFALGIDELGGGGLEVEERLVAVPDAEGERFEALLAGVGRLRLLLGLVGEIEVFEPLGILGTSDGDGQLLGELALPLDRLEDRLLPLGQLTKSCDANLDLADHHLVQTASPLLPISGDERDRVAFVEQLDDALHLHAPDLKVLRDPAQVDLNRVVHEKVYLRKENGDDGGGGAGPPHGQAIRKSRIERAYLPDLRHRMRDRSLYDAAQRTVKRRDRTEAPDAMEVRCRRHLLPPALPKPLPGGIVRTTRTTTRRPRGVCIHSCEMVGADVGLYPRSVGLYPIP